MTDHDACPYCATLRRAINAMSRYWFCRLILGWSEPESSAFSHGVSVERWRLHHACHERFRARRRLEALRARGLSGYKLKAVFKGTTPAVEKSRNNAASRAYRAKWGGNVHMGSEPWRRRELHKFWTRQGRPDLAAQIE